MNNILSSLVIVLMVFFLLHIKCTALKLNRQKNKIVAYPLCDYVRFGHKSDQNFEIQG
jgi:hypothetical protein